VRSGTSNVSRPAAIDTDPVAEDRRYLVFTHLRSSASLLPVGAK
jgi:hypothetical protein